MVETRWRFLFVVGFLGAYKTFSTNNLEFINLFERGQWGLVLLDTLECVFIGLMVVELGMMLGRIL